MNVLLLLMVITFGNCGNGLPCGPVPWSLPALPRLASPTPMPTYVLTAIPPTTGPGTPTVTPQPGTATPTQAFDTAPIDVALATMQSISNSTPAVVTNELGTPVGLDNLEELGSSAGTFFGYAKGVGEASLGPNLSPVFAFSLYAMITIIGVKSLTFMLPIVATVVKFFRTILQFILDFIPL